MPAAPPSLNIPNYGIMDKAWSGLGKIPSPDELLIEFLDNLSLALAPVKRYLEMVEVVMGFYQCTKAVPQAIMDLDPGPIFDCMKILVKAIALVMSWVPPMAYVRLALDLASYFMDVIDEIIAFFVRLDAVLTEYLSILDEATLLGDVELLAIMDCAGSRHKARLGPILDIFKVIQPTCNSLNDMFIRLLPMNDKIQEIKKLKKRYEESSSFLGSFRTALDAGGVLPQFPYFMGTRAIQHPSCPVPPMGDVLEAMNDIRNQMVVLYNLLAPLVGRDPDKTQRDLPGFQNF